MSAESPSDAVLKRVLVACIGNVFLGDDGFGVAVAERLRGRRYPAGVDVGDFGIRGLELAYTLLDGYETVVLVDATPRGGMPGTLYLLEEVDGSSGAAHGLAADHTALDAHSMDPVKVLAFARSLGARFGRILIVGCEPERVGDDCDEMRMALSGPVRAAVEEAVSMIDRLIEELVPTGVSRLS
jgi:hydrogenase maturation protease